MGIGSISGISGYSGISGIYPSYNTTPIRGVMQSTGVTRGSDGTAQATVDGARDAESSSKTNRNGKECQTCKNRKYVDGSNDGNVSFKTPTHISPNNAAAAVMGHEQEHVANARAEGSQANKELVSVSVTLQTETCPECGRVYVSGGVTHTTMKTIKGGDETTNPYAKQQGLQNYQAASGANLNLTA